MQDTKEFDLSHPDKHSKEIQIIQCKDESAIIDYIEKNNEFDFKILDILKRQSVALSINNEISILLQLLAKVYSQPDSNDLKMDTSAILQLIDKHHRNIDKLKNKVLGIQNQQRTLSLRKI